MSYKPKTLVILTPGFAKDESDTTCLPMQQSLIRGLNETFPELKIIILAFQYPYVAKTYQWHGNKVISFDGRNQGGLAKLLLFRKWNFALKVIHRENDLAGLLSFWYRECALVGKRFADKNEIRHYCWMWGQDAKKGNKYVSLTKMKAGELIAFSDFLQEEFEKNYNLKPVHVITPGIDVSEFTTHNLKKDIDLIAAGSLIALKQYDIFIRVIADLKKQHPSIRAVLIGDGPEKQKLQNMVSDAGLHANVTLTGELSHPEVLQWLQRAKVFLHTSNYEGFGIVCIEALAAACQVVSFVKPMHSTIENWHIAATWDEMVYKAGEILAEPGLEFKQVVPYNINQTVQKIADLYSL